MQDFQVFDFHRIFVGDLPSTFLFEIVFRTFIMFSYTILLLRLLGKRGMGQLSTLEVAIIISFGSAVGDPMFGVDVPIIHGMVAVSTIALLQVGLERVINSNKKLEQTMEGKADCLVNEGIISVDMLESNNLSHEDLFRSLRSNEVQHLGEVKKAFFETSGVISVLFQPPGKIKAGLSVLPIDLIPESAYFDKLSKVKKQSLYSCTHCGFTKVFKARQQLDKCEICQCDQWVEADSENIKDEKKG